MSKNHEEIAEAIASHIGIEIGKEFAVDINLSEGQTEEIHCTLNSDGTLNVKEMSSLFTGIILQKLINGSIKPKKKPRHFKPKHGEKYYYIASDCSCSNKGNYWADIRTSVFIDSISDYERIAMGNYFPTFEAAKEAQGKYIESLKDKYKLTIGKLIR